MINTSYRDGVPPSPVSLAPTAAALPLITIGELEGKNKKTPSAVFAGRPKGPRGPRRVAGGHHLSSSGRRPQATAGRGLATGAWAGLVAGGGRVLPGKLAY